MKDNKLVLNACILYRFFVDWEKNSFLNQTCYIMYRVFLIMTITILFSSCGKENRPLEKDDLSGHAQKGPFMNGASVIMAELDKAYVPTGKTYLAEITDNSGVFHIHGIMLVSPYVSIRTDGFYYNEVAGRPSPTRIILNGIADISKADYCNINVLTHLEMPRVQFLLDKGMSFEEAKQQAQSEVFRIFSISTENPPDNSEQLNLTESSEGDAILVAVSAILQGYWPESQLPDMFATIAGDLKEDGIMDNQLLGAHMLAHARVLDTVSIRHNLESRYREMGMNVNVPDFGKYIEEFIERSEYPDTMWVVYYPEAGNYGTNLLDLHRTEYPAMKDLSMVANPPSDYFPLKIKINFISSPDSATYWSYAMSSVQDWKVFDFNNEEKSQVFSATGMVPDLAIRFGKGTYRIEYFEKKGSLPTRSKIITVQ